MQRTKATLSIMSTFLQPDFLQQIIAHNDYVTNCTSNKSKDVHSLSSLVQRTLSQSDCIKLGTGLEKVLLDLIMSNPAIQNIRPKNSKGKKERDHLFLNEATNTIFYAELKSNLNLDTEKCLSTSTKCLQILDELRAEHPTRNIRMFLVGIRYVDKNLIPKIIAGKYSNIPDNVAGVNNYLEAVGIPAFENEASYISFVNSLADAMFE